MAVSMSCDYLGQLHCRLTHGPSGNAVDTDAPVDNAGRGQSFSPTDLVGAALLSCALTTMAIKGAKHGIALGRCSGTVTKTMTESGPRAIARLNVAIALPDDLSGDDRQALQHFAETCPVALSLATTTRVKMVFN